MRAKIRISRVFILLVTIVVLLGNSFLADAEAPYDTYAYSYNGNALKSPHAYIPQERISEFGSCGTLNTPEDMVSDSHRHLIVADKGNDRVVILDESLNTVCTIGGYTDENGNKQTFNNPQGIYAASDGVLYVADSGNGRIVLFDDTYQYIRTIAAPSSDVLPDDFFYQPVAVAADDAGNIYVVSKNTNMGVITFDKTGAFKGFIGAQRVAANAAELFWRMFMTEEQIQRSTSYVPCTYSNLTIDEKGFVYVTSSGIDRYNLYNSRRSSDSTYAPVKKINPNGTDVLRRNGFFAPMGDINFDEYSKGRKNANTADNSSNQTVEPSAIGEITLLPNGMYTLVDTEHSKLFTYDSYGNLLYAFGGEGESVGLYAQLAAAAYIGDTLYTLDSQSNTITVSAKTNYAKLLDEEIYYQEIREYDKANALWGQILEQNNNYDLAYYGMGKIALEKGDYQQAMSYFQMISNKTYYGKAFKFYRQEILNKYGLIAIAVIIILVVLVVKWFKYAKRYNRKARESAAQHTLRSELMYSFFLIFHPFKGFDELKHEKRGSVRSATVLIALGAFSYTIKDTFCGYLSRDVEHSPMLLNTISFLLPLFLWCIANWCLTSLMDGNGKFRDIYIYTAYAITPVILVLIPATIISNFLVSDELSILTMATTMGYIWFGLLLVFGSMTTHEYSFGKNLIVVVLTIIGIGIILFLLILFFNLTGQMIVLVDNIIKEVSYRS